MGISPAASKTAPDRSAGLIQSPVPTSRTERNCSVARTLDIVGDAWSFLIIREAFFRIRAFDGFQRALGIPRATLTERLRTLTGLGIFRHVPATPGSRRREYRLTRKGYDLYPSFIALMQFGDRWASTGPPPLRLHHRTCGCDCRPVVACSSCGKQLVARAVTYRDGPGAGRTPVRPGRAKRRPAVETFATGRPSSVARALQLIGDRWSIMVVREAFFGVRRYDQIQSNLGIAPNILTDRLNRFIRSGILARTPYRQKPVRHEYRLTPMGSDLYGPFVAMLAWGDRWLSGGRPPLALTHRQCGADMAAMVICDRCDRPIQAADMDYRLAYDPDNFVTRIRSG